MNDDFKSPLNWMLLVWGSAIMIMWLAKTWNRCDLLEIPHNLLMLFALLCGVKTVKVVGTTIVARAQAMRGSPPR